MENFIFCAVFVLFHLRHVNSIGTICTQDHTVHYHATFESGWDCWKNYWEKCDNMYIPGIGISLVPHLNLNSITFSPFVFDTILIDRPNLFHCHIYTYKAPLNRIVLYILLHTRYTFKLAHVLINTLKQTIRQAFRFSIPGRILYDFSVLS